MGNAVTMTDKDILVIIMIGSTMSQSLKLLLITSYHQGATTLSHVLTITVNVRALYRLTTSYYYTIGTLATHATIVPRHEEIVIASMPHDERSLNGVGTSILTGRIRHTVQVFG
jgi:hypothetical protein